MIARDCVFESCCLDSLIIGIACPVINSILRRRLFAACCSAAVGLSGMTICESRLVFAESGSLAATYEWNMPSISSEEVTNMEMSSFMMLYW